MRIDINQKKIAFGNKFTIVKGGETILRAASKLFRILSVTDLFQPNRELPLGTIRRRLAVFNAKYDIEIINQASYHFSTVSYWKNHHQCRAGNTIYDVYGHRGRKYSIHKNGEQVAYFKKEAVTFFEGDNYMLIANDDADHLLLVIIVLIVDNYRSNNKNDSAINIDIGHIFQACKFDQSWTPQISIDQ